MVLDVGAGTGETTQCAICMPHAFKGQGVLSCVERTVFYLEAKNEGEMSKGVSTGLKCEVATSRTIMVTEPWVSALTNKREREREEWSTGGPS